MHQAPDAELIETLRERRDELAFRTLYRRHSSRLYQLILRFAGGRVADAETWLRAVRRLEDFRPAESLPAWLRGFAVNVAREWLRARRREEERFADVDPDALAAEATLPEVDDLEGAIAALPAGYRAVLVLHDIEGFTHEEVATSLEIAVGTSKSQLFEARRALRRMLQVGEQNEGVVHG
jgi:RNA polymerase sigma-70 factor (ECF subfamily)